MGLQRLTATGMTPAISILLKAPPNNAILVPKREDIMKCENIGDINSLLNSTTQIICPRNFVPVPLF